VREQLPFRSATVPVAVIGSGAALLSQVIETETKIRG
jgi:hypothetical protein